MEKCGMGREVEPGTSLELGLHVIDQMSNPTEARSVDEEVDVGDMV